LISKSLGFVQRSALSTGVTMQFTESTLLTRMTAGPRTELELVGNGVMSKHVIDCLNDLQKKGFAVFLADNWLITKFGREALAAHKKPSRKSLAVPRETYDGSELRHRVQREGAYDFLACPSRYGDKFVQRPL
jgi:hypothetical protein